MDAAGDCKHVNTGNSLRLDLSAMKNSPPTEKRDGLSSCLATETNASPSSPGEHERHRKEYLAEGAGGSEFPERSAVALPPDSAADSRFHCGSGDEAAVPNFLGYPGVAAVGSSHARIFETVKENNGACQSSFTSDSQCNNSSISSANVGNTVTNTSRRLNLAYKAKRQGEQVSPPSSSPARLEGPLSKCGASAPQRPESSSTAFGAMFVGIEDRKVSSFTASTNTLARKKRPMAAYTPAARVVNLSSEMINQGSSRMDGHQGNLLAIVKASNLNTQQTENDVTHRGGTQRGQQNDQTEETSSQTSGDSKEVDEEGEQYGSSESDSCKAESPEKSSKEGNSEEENDGDDQNPAEAYPAVVEMDLDDQDEDDCPEGELRFNMRTGKFSKAYVVRNAASHHILPRQRRTTVAGAKGSEPTWIFPWEVRPNVDVFAAAAAAKTAFSAGWQRLPPSRHSNSACLNAPTSSRTLSAGRAPQRRLADGSCLRGKPPFKPFQRSDAEEKQANKMIDERQKESVFDCLSKMAQANEWAQMLKINRNYRAFRTREGKLACHVYQGKSHVKRLPVEVKPLPERPKFHSVNCSRHAH